MMMWVVFVCEKRVLKVKFFDISWLFWMINFFLGLGIVVIFLIFILVKLFFIIVLMDLLMMVKWLMFLKF